LIYADNASTTQLSKGAFESMLPYLSSDYGNASSRHMLGVRAQNAVKLARNQIANAIGAENSEIIFTSCGSESNNLVLQSVSTNLSTDKETHIITSSIEHHSVLSTCSMLEKRGIKVTYLPVDGRGVVSLSDVKRALRPSTKLISIMLANNEIGTIQPIAEISQLIKDTGILFHVDAVQAVGHIQVNVSNLGVDFLTASAHKFNGPKGSGFLYIRSGLKLHPLIYGGEQEFGIRAGTENVAGIVGMGYAIWESVKLIDYESCRLKEMVKETIRGIKDTVETFLINGDSDNKLPGILNISLNSISGQSLMHILSMKGICVSTGSACNSLSDEPSHVLLQIGRPKNIANSQIRISYGRYNTLEEVGVIVREISSSYKKIKNLL
jgi:cysteine desulfurase